MNMKLIMALVDDHLTERVIEAARKAGRLKRERVIADPYRVVPDGE